MAVMTLKRTMRRVAGLVLLVAASTATFLWRARWAEAWNTRPQVFTGWLLVTVLAVLVVFNLRKKIRRLPIFRVYDWLTVHVYAGLFCGVVFVLHVGPAWPSTRFNEALLVLFAVVFVSGVFGLWLSRALPRRLKDRGEEVIYERIPALRHTLRRRLIDLIDEDLAGEATGALPEFAVNTVLPFLDGPRHFWGHLFHVTTDRHRMQQQLDAIGRFLNAKEQQRKARIERIIEAKDDLDYAWAHQSLLKYWLFVHVPLTYALLVLLPIHVAWAEVF